MLPIESLNHFFGVDGRAWYNFWSGLGADLGELAFLGAAVGLYRKHNCHVHRCWRLAKQPVTGTSWIVCHKHHPEGKPTADTIAAADKRHHEALAAAESLAISHAAKQAEDDAATQERQENDESRPTPQE